MSITFTFTVLEPSTLSSVCSFSRCLRYPLLHFRSYASSGQYARLGHVTNGLDELFFLVQRPSSVLRGRLRRYWSLLPYFLFFCTSTPFHTGESFLDRLYHYASGIACCLLFHFTFHTCGPWKVMPISSSFPEYHHRSLYPLMF